MSILHLVRRSAFETQDLSLCLLALTAGDKVILLDDGCYNLHHPLIREVKQICTLGIVKIHAEARAVSLITAEDNKITVLSMNELTQIFSRFDAISTWQ
jgi:tRNA 2-thiouridine synthesizing protein B